MDVKSLNVVNGCPNVTGNNCHSDQMFCGRSVRVEMSLGRSVKAPLFSLLKTSMNSGCGFNVVLQYSRHAPKQWADMTSTNALPFDSEDIWEFEMKTLEINQFELLMAQL